MPLSKVEELLFNGISDDPRIAHFRVNDDCLQLTVTDKHHQKPSLCACFPNIRLTSLNVLTSDENLFQKPWKLDSVGAQYINDQHWQFNLRCNEIEFLFESNWPISLPSVA